MKKQIIIFLLTYFTVTVIRALILINTGFTFINIFVDAFELVPFLIDVLLWTASYALVSLLVSSLTKKKAVSETSIEN